MHTDTFQVDHYATVISERGAELGEIDVRAVGEFDPTDGSIIVEQVWAGDINLMAADATALEREYGAAAKRFLEQDERFEEAVKQPYQAIVDPQSNSVVGYEVWA